MDPTLWILAQWREEISGTSGRGTAGKTIIGEKSSGKAISGENSRTALFHTMLTVSRTIPIPFAIRATKRAIFHPSAQREKEKGKMARAKERVEKDFKEKATANFSPKEDVI